MRPVASTPRPLSRRARVGLALWACALVVGFGALHRASSIPGEALAAPARWPASAAIPPDETRPTLLLFAHPHCPCTRATVRQLATLDALRGGAVRVVALLSGPAVDERAADSLAAHAAGALRASIVPDPSGEEARRFGATTSGHAILYSPRGDALFSGGVTPGRGHEGRSDSLDALARALRTASPSRDPFPVFGCPIFDAHDRRDHDATNASQTDCCAVLSPGSTTP